MPASASSSTGFVETCPRAADARDMRISGSPAKWNDTRVIIFTEYDDTKRYLAQQLSAAIATTERAGDRIAIYHGPTPAADREEIKRAFTTDPKKYPIRILIATDAAREGLNLQTHCGTSSTSTFPGTPAASNSATAASTASSSPTRGLLPLLRLHRAQGRPDSRGSDQKDRNDQT